MTERVVRIYSRFERLWHWMQAALIFALLFSGMGLRGIHGLIGFGAAVTLHTIAALALMALWLFAIFWHLTTGAWRHYTPTAAGLPRVVRFYVWGIFRGERHPYRKAYWRKHNPLQALTYLGLKLVLFPWVWISGLLYLSYNAWDDAAGAGDALTAIGDAHALAAYGVAAFIVAHVYLLTTGHSFVAHVRPMIDGYDTVALTPAEEAYLADDEPERLKS